MDSLIVGQCYLASPRTWSNFLLVVKPKKYVGRFIGSDYANVYFEGLKRNITLSKAEAEQTADFFEFDRNCLRTDKEVERLSQDSKYKTSFHEFTYKKNKKIRSHQVEEDIHEKREKAKQEAYKEKLAREKQRLEDLSKPSVQAAIYDAELYFALKREAYRDYNYNHRYVAGDPEDFEQQFYLKLLENKKYFFFDQNQEIERLKAEESKKRDILRQYKDFERY